MSLPNVKNIRNLAGEGYFKPAGQTAFVTLGHTESISVTHNAEREAIYSSISGIRRIADYDVTETNASGSMVLRETGARQIALAVLATDATLTQSAESGLTLTGSAAAGDTIDLGRLDVSITSLTDGVDPLVAGEDYELDAAAGILTFKTDQATFDLVYSCAAISAIDDQAIIAAFSAPQGIEGDLLVIQRQKRGETRWKYAAKVRIFPDGELPLSREGTDKATVGIAFEVVEDTSKPEGSRFGILQEVKGA